MKVLFVYPNLYGMNMLPTAVGILNAILKNEGHTTAIFDTTSYIDWGEGYAPDKLKEKNLNARPSSDVLLRQDEKHTSPTDDFRKCVESFSPDLIALSVTEDNYPNGVDLLRAIGHKDRPF